MKKENLCLILFFFSHDTIDSRAIAVISFFKPASILFGYLLFDVLQWRTIIYFFFSGKGEGRVEEGVKKNAGDAGEVGTNVWSKPYRRLL